MSHAEYVANLSERPAVPLRRRLLEEVMIPEMTDQPNEKERP